MLVQLHKQRRAAQALAGKLCYYSACTSNTTACAVQAVSHSSTLLMQSRQQRADALQRIESGVLLETSGRVRLRPLPGGRSPNSTGTLEFSITDEIEFAELQQQQQQCEGEALTAAQPLSSSSDGFAESDGAGAASRGGFATAAAAVVASFTVATVDSAAALLSSRSSSTAAAAAGAAAGSAVISVTSPRSPSRQVHPSSPCHSALSVCSGDAPAVTRHCTTLSLVSWLRDGGTAASCALLVALLALEVTSTASISSCSGSGNSASDEQLQAQLQQQQRRRRARLALAIAIVVLQLVLLACAAVARRRSNTLSLKGERRLHPSNLMNNSSSSSAAAYKVPAGAGAGATSRSAGETPFIIDVESYRSVMLRVLVETVVA
jgi:hypothetical protein